jgi:hypothetical protein
LLPVGIRLEPVRNADQGKKENPKGKERNSLSHGVLPSGCSALLHNPGPREPVFPEAAERKGVRNLFGVKKGACTFIGLFLTL